MIVMGMCIIIVIVLLYYYYNIITIMSVSIMIIMLLWDLLRVRLAGRDERDLGLGQLAPEEYLDYNM